MMHNTVLSCLFPQPKLFVTLLSEKQRMVHMFVVKIMGIMSATAKASPKHQPSQDHEERKDVQELPETCSHKSRVQKSNSGEDKQDLVLLC